jgi:hypothetical protein
MALDDIIRSAVATVNSVTTSAQVTITHYARTGQDKYNKPAYAAGVARLAFVVKKLRQIVTKDGDSGVSQAQVVFTYPVAIAKEDKLVLPDGTTGSIIDIDGVYDPDTNLVYNPIVELGR